MKKLTSEYVENLINKIMTQAESGQVQIINQDGSLWNFYVKLDNNMSSKINNGNLSIMIRNKETLIQNMKEYLSQARMFYGQDKDYFELTETSFDEKLVMDLFINATNFELNNFEKYVNSRTNMLKDNSTFCGKIQLGEYNGCGIVAEIVKNHSNLEGPYKFKIEFQKDNESFVLPNITFGKVTDKVIVYAIQGLKDKQENKLAKQLDRHFRKANKDVDMDDEMLSQISTNALISLVVFAAYQKEMGAESFEAVSFMPVRYATQQTRGEMMTKNNCNAQFQFLDRHDKNQFNMTNRFLNTMIRYAHHFDLPADFNETTENLIITLTNKDVKVDNIVNEIDKEIRVYLNRTHNLDY